MTCVLHRGRGESTTARVPAPGSSLSRWLVAAYPWPAPLYQGQCQPATGTALLVRRIIRLLPAGPGNGWNNIEKQVTTRHYILQIAILLDRLELEGR